MSNTYGAPASFDQRFAPAMPGVDFNGRLAMASQGQQPGLVQDMRGQDPTNGQALLSLMQRFMGNASRKLIPPGMGPAAPSGSLGDQAGYNDIGNPMTTTEGAALVQRFLKHMHKSPVLKDGSDSGFPGGNSNY